MHPVHDTFCPLCTFARCTLNPACRTSHLCCISPEEPKQLQHVTLVESTIAAAMCNLPQKLSRPASSQAPAAPPPASQGPQGQAQSSASILASAGPPQPTSLTHADPMVHDSLQLTGAEHPPRGRETRCCLHPFVGEGGVPVEAGGAGKGGRWVGVGAREGVGTQAGGRARPHPRPPVIFTAQCHIFCMVCFFWSRSALFFGGGDAIL